MKYEFVARVSEGVQETKRSVHSQDDHTCMVCLSALVWAVSALAYHPRVAVGEKNVLLHCSLPWSVCPRQQ